MPYISPTKRPHIDRVVDLLSGWIDSPGELNYAITKLLLARKPESYVEFNALVGVLECCKLEFYRRALSVYEDGKAVINGDVYPPVPVGGRNDKDK